MVSAGIGGMFRPASARAALVHTLAGETGSTRVVLVNSGTSALRLALVAAAARRPGLPVALPAYGCYDLATAVRGAGVQVRFYDVSPRTLMPERESVIAAFADGLAAIVLVHQYGVGVDVGTWRSLARQADALIIEDAAQGAGLTIDGRPAGSWGDLAVLSFARGKGRTGGAGGALLFNGCSDAWAGAIGLSSRAADVRILIGVVGQWILGRPSLYWLPHMVPGSGLGLTVERPVTPAREISAASSAMICAGTSPSAEAAMSRRRAAAAWLADIPEAMVPGGRAVCAGGALRFPVLLRSASDRDAFVNACCRAGVTAGYPLSLADLPSVQAHLAAGGAAIAGARSLASRLALLPTHDLISDHDRQTILNGLRTGMRARTQHRDGEPATPART